MAKRSLLSRCPSYIHKVPVVLHDNLQRDSQKPYGLPPSVTWFHLSCTVLAPTSLWTQEHADLGAHDFVHYHELWYQTKLVNITCARKWRLCGITPSISFLCYGMESKPFVKELSEHVCVLLCLSKLAEKKSKYCGTGLRVDSHIVKHVLWGARCLLLQYTYLLTYLLTYLHT